MSRIPLGTRKVSHGQVTVPADVERFGYPQNGTVEVEYDASEHSLIYRATNGDHEECEAPPKAADDFAAFYEEQLRRARSSNGEQPASPEEVAQKYRQQLKLARKEVMGDTDLRDYYIRRAYSFDAGSMSDLAEIFEISSGSISDILRDDPHINTPGRPNFNTARH